jgi:hypothetical protein
MADARIFEATYLYAAPEPLGLDRDDEETYYERAGDYASERNPPRQQKLRERYGWKSGGSGA